MEFAVLRGDDGGVDDAVELVEAAVREGFHGERGAVELAVGTDDRRAEGLDDGGVDRFAGAHHVAAERIGLEDGDAGLGPDEGDGTFAAADAARESYPQHASILRRRVGARCRCRRRP